ncbi:unnamed protein product [Brassica oleracea var. botrytis]
MFNQAEICLEDPFSETRPKERFVFIKTVHSVLGGNQYTRIKISHLRRIFKWLLGKT